MFLSCVDFKVTLSAALMVVGTQSLMYSWMQLPRCTLQLLRQLLSESFILSELHKEMSATALETPHTAGVQYIPNLNVANIAGPSYR